MNTCLIGDCRDSMRAMIADGVKVQCVITSPPYYALRDYGVDGQLGLEATPAEYLTNMLDVFRLVWEVLADDGTLWLNLGMSYASGGMNASQSPLRMRVPSCGSDGKVPQDSLSVDHASPGSCDEDKDENLTRHGRTVRTGQSAQQDEPQLSKTSRDNAHSDLSSLLPDASPPSAQASTTQRSLAQLPDASCQVTKASACQSEPPIGERAPQESVRNSACTSDIFQKSMPLVSRTVGKESFFSACHRSDCKGIGRCGYCWCSLAIPSLNIKAKDEINLPHLFAMALQADGWILRQTIIWAKPNPMPESVTDRTTKSHEYVFLLAKQGKYYFDAESIKEPSVGELPISRMTLHEGLKAAKLQSLVSSKLGTPADSTRNKRSVWNVPSEPLSSAALGVDTEHFAAFPRKLIEPMILAGTSERGHCPQCGKGWERIVERSRTFESGSGRSGNDINGKNGPGLQGGGYGDIRMGPTISSVTTGWQPGCDHGLDPVPGVVFDPFFGSGTVGEVAQALGRNWLGCELNPNYEALQKVRTRQPSLGF